VAVILEGKYYNVEERFTLYDTIAITSELDNLSIKPPGWYSTFALFSGASNHSFFNIRNTGNCERPYCNLQTKDTMPFAFQIDSIGLAFWACGMSYYNIDQGDTRFYLPNALWQADLPFETAATFRVQQDDKLKTNAGMLSPGYGPFGGGFGNLGRGAYNAGLTGIWPLMTTQTQGMPTLAAPFRLPNKIGVPRKASIALEISLSPYARDMVADFPGPGVVPIYAGGEALDDYAVMFGITATINGARLVQQRGAPHA
jgi:hypothetical protein